MEGGTQVNNITKSVADALAGSTLKAGIVTVFVKHTTAAVMIIEDEPGIRADTKTFWDRLIPPDPRWQHNRVNPGDEALESSAGPDQLGRRGLRRTGDWRPLRQTAQPFVLSGLASPLPPRPRSRPILRRFRGRARRSLVTFSQPGLRSGD